MSICDTPAHLLRAAEKFGVSLFLVALFTLMPTIAQAATIDVDGTTCTLVEAIPVANLDTDANGCVRSGGGSDDTLVLVPGSTTSFIVGAFNHDGLTATPSVTSTIIISGGVIGAEIERTPPLNFRLFHVASEGDLTFDNIALVNGNISGDGGAIYNWGNVTLLNSVIVSGTASGTGGGIYGATGSDIVLEESAILTGTAFEGGAIYLTGGTLDVFDAEFIGNSAAYGGALAHYANSTSTFDGVDFIGNQASIDGGAIYNYDSSEMTIEFGTFEANQAVGIGGAVANDNASTVQFAATDFLTNTAASGGAIHNLNSSTLILQSSYFISNTAIANGGAIHNASSSSATLGTTQLLSNTATSGGGIYNTGTAMTMTIGGMGFNLATANGGAIYNENSSFAIAFIGIVSNTAESGGGLYSTSGSNVFMLGSGFLNNQANRGGGVYNITNSDLTLTSVEVVGNVAVLEGGGIYNYDSSAMTLTASSILSNTADFGGGFVNSNNSTAALGGTFVQFNTAGIWGGGIFNTNGGVTDIATSTISNNLSEQDGAGIFNTGTSTVTLTNSEIQANHAMTLGGGLVNTVSSRMNLFDTDLLDNTANDAAGLYHDGFLVEITGGEVSRNVAAVGGGGLYNINSLLNVTGTILAENDATYGGALANLGGTLTVTNSSLLTNTVDDTGSALYQISGQSFITDNCIVGNEATAVFYATGTAIDATNVWWGAPDGPSGAASGAGDSISNNVLYEPFQSSAPLFCSTRVATLAIDKFASPTGNLLPGQPLTYTIVFTNTGEQELYNLFVSDTLPANFVLEDIEGTGANLTFNGTHYIVDAIPASSVATLNLVGYVTTTLTSNVTLENTVSVTSSLVALLTATTSNNVTMPVVNWSSPTYTADEDSGTFNATVTLTPPNPYMTATVEAVSTDSAEVASVSAVQTVSFVPGSSTANVPVPITDDSDVAGREIALALQSPVGAVLGNTDTATIAIVEDDAAAAIAVIKRANVTQASVGDTITYTYDITNTGNVTLTTVTGDDDQLGALTGLGGQWLPGEARTTSLTYIVQPADAGSPLVNTVTVNGTDIFDTDVSDSASLTVNIASPEEPAPAIEVTKSSNVPQARVGDTITYTYRITNTGNVTLTTVTGDDDQLGALTGLSGQWLPGEARSTTLTYVVQPADANTVLVNTVVVTGTDTFDIDVTDSATLSVAISDPTNLPEGEQPQQQFDMYLPRLDD